MQPVHRVAAFFCLCVVFGISVWLLDGAYLDIRANLAAVDEAGFYTPVSSSFDEAGFNAPATSPVKQEQKEKADVNELCKAGERIEYVYDEKGELQKKVVSTIKRYGFLTDTSKCEQEVQFKGATCKVTYGCQNGNCFCVGLEPLSDSGGPRFLAAAQGALRQVFSENQATSCGESCMSRTLEQISAVQTQTITASDLRDRQVPPLGVLRPAEVFGHGQQLQSQSLTGAGTNQTSFAPNTQVAGNPSVAQQNLNNTPSTQQRLADMAAGNQNRVSSANAPVTTFTPTQQLSNQTSLSPLFGGAVDTGGSVSTGGSFAYAPAQQPGYYNRNFDSVGIPSAFTQRPITADDLIKQLVANTPKERTVVTASELSGGVTSGGLGETFVSLGASLFSPVAEFVNNIFSPETSQNELDYLAEIEGAGLFKKELLELEHVELMIVPGDPQQVFDSIEEIVRNADEHASNPFFSGALVRTNPWDDSGGSLSGYFGFDSSAVASSEETPISSSGGEQEMGDSIQNSFDAAKSPNVFSAMKLTIGTIAQAVADLFKNIAATLFWWL